MTTPSSSPRDESAQPGEGEAEVIAFPQAPAESDPEQGADSERQWPGQLIDLDTARAMAGVTADDTAAVSAEIPAASDDEADGDVSQQAGARVIALRSLAARARSEAELRAKLADRGVEAEAIDQVIAGLMAEGLIDDRQLAADLAQNLQETKKMGPVAVRQALMKRRISRVIIDEVVAGLDAVEIDTLEELARSRMRVLEGLDRDVQVRRLVGYLARRGYQGSDVYQAIDRVVGRG